MLERFDTERVRHYYKECELWLPPHASQRIFKFRLASGKVLVREVTRLDKLRRLLVDLAPVDVWYSMARWASPADVWPKRRRVAGHEFFDNLCYGVDVPFDIDGDFSVEGLEEARVRTLKLVRSLPAGLKLKYVLFTGTKGFQVVCEKEGQNERFFVLRGQNELRERHGRKAYIQALPKGMIPKRFDEEVTTDPYRVVRLPLTARRTGFAATFVSVKDLQKPIAELLKTFKHFTLDRPRIPHREMTKPRDYGHSKSGARSGLSAHSPISSISSIAGNRSVIILKYHEKQDWKADLERLERTYRLGPYIVFSQGENVWVFGVELFDIERVKKIFAASRAKNKTGMIKYSKAFLNIRVKGEEFELLKVSKQACKGPKSYAHATFVKAISGIDFLAGNVCDRPIEFRLVGGRAK